MYNIIKSKEDFPREISLVRVRVRVRVRQKKRRDKLEVAMKSQVHSPYSFSAD